MAGTVNWRVVSETRKIRVLVVDDHATMREGICAVVNSQPDMIVVGEASDGQAAIEQFKTLQPDISLVDWNLPLVSGAEVISALSREFPGARFIVMTALTGEDNIRRALRFGARSFLYKNMLRRELLPAIRAVDKGQEYLPAKIVECLKDDR